MRSFGLMCVLMISCLQQVFAVEAHTLRIGILVSSTL